MKKSKVLVTILMFLLIGCLFFCLIACDLTGGGNNGENKPAHTHTWSETYSSDDVNHWFACSGCNQKKNLQSHSFFQNYNTQSIWQECSACKLIREHKDFTQGLIFALNSDNESYSVSSFGNLSVSEVVIPNIYNGKPVLSIGDSAFKNNSQIEKVIIPNGILRIENEAFANCKNLFSVNIGYKNVIANEKTGIDTLDDIIQPTDTSIGYRAFYNDTSLTSVKIGGDITIINGEAFAYCDELKSLVVGEKIESIGEKAFYGCHNLSYVLIPSSVKNIEENAFSGCSKAIIYCESPKQNWNLSGCTIIWDCNKNDIADNGNIYTIINGLRYVIKDNTALVTSQLASVSGDIVIPQNIEYCEKLYEVVDIEEYAFSRCNNVKSVVIPNNLTKISDYAFSYCEGLENITFGSKIEEIGNHSFWGCINIKELIFPDSVKYIGAGAFYQCRELSKITIGKNLELIKDAGFNECDKLKNLNVTDIVSFCKYGQVSYTLWHNIENLYINNVLVVDLVLPDNVTVIGNMAFDSCKALHSITLSNSITDIDLMTFSRSEIENITIPATVKSIGGYVFKDSNKLESINFKGTKEQWIAINKDSNWNAGTKDFIIICTDGKLDKDGNNIE